MFGTRTRTVLPHGSFRIPGVLLTALSAFASGCTFTPGGIGLPEAGLDMTITGTAPANDPVDRAALAALNEGASRWQERASGAEGTVKALSAIDPKGCVSARLLVHDYKGVRMEDRRLCPTGASRERFAAVPSSSNTLPSDNASPPAPSGADAADDTPTAI